MKTKLTLLIIIFGFLFTSCYTQFATVKESDEYVVKRERQYKKYEKQESDAETYYEDEDNEEYTDEDEYYEDDDSEYVSVAEYHYSSRPYVYRYRFAHYDPYYDEYVYYNRPVTVISVHLGRNYYDPYWAGFYCGPYDYVDPWFGWCGYGYTSYYPYYYGHYYHDRYYGGYYDGYYGRRGYRNHHNSYSRDYYASNWGRRPFTASKPGRLAARPERPTRPDGISRPSRPMDMPASRPVVSRPVRQNEPYTLERPIRKAEDSRNLRPAVYKEKTSVDKDRKYKRKYYNSSDRIKSELDKSRKEATPIKRRRPSERSNDYKGNSKPVKRSSRYNTDRKEKSSSVKTRPRKTREKTYNDTKSKPSKKYRKERTRPKSVSKPKSRSRESKPRKSYTKPRSSNTRSSAPKVRSKPSRSSSSGSRSSRSSVRSAPSRSSGSSSRSSGRSSSSSGRSKSSGGSSKRPR